MEVVSFIIKNRDDEDFDDYIEKANVVWKKSFNNSYDYGCCPSNWVIIGFNTEDEVVCAAIFETSLNEEYYEIPENIEEDACMISCVGSYPENIGNGSKLMINLIEFIKEKNIKRAYVNIDKDDNEDKLIYFYNKFGFTENTEYGSLNDDERQRCLYIK